VPDPVEPVVEQEVEKKVEKEVEKEAETKEVDVLGALEAALDKEAGDDA